MTDHRLELTRALRQIMRSHAPGWTDSNDSDPGVTILEVIAYLAEDLQFGEAAGSAVSSAAARAIAALEGLADRELVAVAVNGRPWQIVDSLAGAGADAAVFTLDHATGEITFGDGVNGRVPDSGPIVVRYRQGQGADGNATIAVSTTWPPLQRSFGVFFGQRGTQPSTPDGTVEHWGGSTRPTYFSGQVLGVQDFQAEQQYHRGKRRLHLQALHGSGVARGLEVVVSSDGTSLTVEPGLAIDPSGNEIVIDQPVLVTPPCPLASPGWLSVEYAERDIDIVPTLQGPQARRIQEGCRIILALSPSETGITLARMVREGSAWRLDPSFVPARVRCL
jgi:hypothetical protein